MALRRLTPLAILGTSAVTLVTRGPELTKTVVDTVKVTLTQYELAQLRDRIVIDLALGREDAPDPAKPPSLGAYIRANATAVGRDPASDLWGQDYQMRTSDTDRFVVLSWGPNLGPDQCASSDAPTPEADDVCAAIPRP